jgi:endonuclease/exonuclease/phosphatase family metal-dependent hydrolase
MSTTSLPLSAPTRVSVRASPRVRRRRRQVLLAAAILSTALGVGLAVAHNGAVIGRALEGAWWTLSPATSVTHIRALSDYSGVELGWAANDRAAEYTVTVSTDAALRHPIDRLTTTATHVELTGLTEGTTYYYGVAWASELGNEGVGSSVERITTAFHQVAAPTGIAVAATASAFTLDWPVVDWATDYVVRMSTSKDPAAFGQSPADVQFPATTATTLTTQQLSKAATGDRYYFTVTASNRDLSSAVSAVTGHHLLVDPPKKAAIVGTSTTGATVSWSAVAGATKYVIERSSSADFSTVDGTYSVPRAYSRMSVNGLAPGTEYFFRVKAESGSLHGEGSTPVAATTRASGSVALRVATYNVLDPRLGTRSLAPWSERRKNIARTIDAADADIVALQEAGWSKVKHGLTPAQDIRNLIDKRMTLSKAGRKGDQMLYSSATFAAGPHGSFTLPRISGDGVRSAIWQEFRDKSSGAHFIAVSTHLTSGIENNAGRLRQAKTIVAKVRALNKSGLPVVIMGDLNSYDARATTTPMSTFASAGYLDAELSTPATDTPDLNTWVKATSTTGSVRFDHIAVSESVAVTRTAIENLKGKASDHRLLWADLAISTS